MEDMTDANGVASAIYDLSLRVSVDHTLWIYVIKENLEGKYCVVSATSENTDKAVQWRKDDIASVFFTIADTVLLTLRNASEEESEVDYYESKDEAIEHFFDLNLA